MSSGKPVGVLGVVAGDEDSSRGRLQPTVGGRQSQAVGTIAGIGFTVSLLRRTLAFDGRQLEERSVGILCSAIGLRAASPGVVSRHRVRLGGCGFARCLARPRAHRTSIPTSSRAGPVRGPIEAPFTLVEYGRLRMPLMRQRNRIVRELLPRLWRVRLRLAGTYLLSEVLLAPNSMPSGEAAAIREISGMHDLCSTTKTSRPERPVGYASSSSSTSTAQAELRDQLRLGSRCTKDIRTVPTPQKRLR